MAWQQVASKALKTVDESAGMWAISSVGTKDAQKALSTAGQMVCVRAVRMADALVLRQVASRVAMKACEWAATTGIP